MQMLWDPRGGDPHGQQRPRPIATCHETLLTDLTDGLCFPDSNGLKTQWV